MRGQTGKTASDNYALLFFFASRIMLKIADHKNKFGGILDTHEVMNTNEHEAGLWGHFAIAPLS